MTAERQDAGLPGAPDAQIRAAAPRPKPPPAPARNGWRSPRTARPRRDRGTPDRRLRARAVIRFVTVGGAPIAQFCVPSAPPDLSGYARTWLPPSRCAIADELPSSAQSEEVESLGLVSGRSGAAALGDSED